MSAQPLAAYAREQAGARLERLARQVERAAARPDADAIHDLRVAIRRFGQSLRVFAPLFQARRRNRVRRRLRKVMDLGAAVRDRDIALELLARAGAPPGGAAVRRLKRERRDAEAELVAAVERWQQRGFAAKWREKLEL